MHECAMSRISGKSMPDLFEFISSMHVDPS